jgi:hypothetical protein
MSKRQRPKPPPRRRPRPGPAWVTASSSPIPMGDALTERLNEAARLGELTRSERLRIAFDFVAADLAVLSDEQRAARLRALFTIVRPRRVDTESGPIMWDAATHPEQASLSALRDLQTQLRDGLRDFLRPATAWAIPAPRAAVLVRNDAHARGATTWRWQADAWPMLVAGIADLVWEHADRVRACQLCARVFLANKRQQFCTPDHAQQARDHRKVTRRRGGK